MRSRRGGSFIRLSSLKESIGDPRTACLAEAPASMWHSIRDRVRQLKREVHALYLAARHPATPWAAKLFVAGVVAYALSPIDLIPDFIPVLGYLDDLILLPLGIMVAIRLIPANILAECRERAVAAERSAPPGSRTAAVVIVGIWILIAGACVLWVF